jgi:hypothetical protein
MSVSRVIPGFAHFPKFIPSHTLPSLKQETEKLQQTIRSAAVNIAKVRTKTYLSSQHNRNTDEYYQLLAISDQDRKISLQYFNRYGETGHELSYFIGNRNIPSWIKASLISRIEDLPQVKALKAGNWNATLNTYSVTQDRKTPEFPFHKDVASNGAISAVFSFGRQGFLEMQKETVSHTIPLQEGSLVLLAGDARWEWEHRVVSTSSDLAVGACYRQSIVLGCSQ